MISLRLTRADGHTLGRLLFSSSTSPFPSASTSPHLTSPHLTCARLRHHLAGFVPATSAASTGGAPPPRLPPPPWSVATLLLPSPGWVGVGAGELTGDPPGPGGDPFGGVQGGGQPS